MPREISKDFEIKEGLDTADPQGRLSLWANPNCPAGSGLARVTIEGLAEQWAGRTGDREELDWIKTFVTGMGGDITGQSGAPLLLVASSQACFRVSSQRAWQLAMAIGHLAIHLPHVDLELGPLAVRNRVSPLMADARAVSEASWFAAVFLMPEQIMRAQWIECSGNLQALGGKFHVPVVSAAARAYRLGLS